MLRSIYRIAWKIPHAYSTMFRFLCCCGLVIVEPTLSLKRLVVRARSYTRVYPSVHLSYVQCSPRISYNILHIQHIYKRQRSNAILNEIRDHRAFALRNEELVWMFSFPVLSPRPFTRMSLVVQLWIKSFLPDRNKCLLSDFKFQDLARYAGKLILVRQCNIR